MERQEFSRMLEEARETENCGKNELCRRTGLAFNQWHVLEIATYNYYIDNVFLCLNALQYAIKIYNANKCYILKNRSDFSKAFIKIRKDAGLSQRKLAEVLGLAQGSISVIESGNRNTSIDKFLKCIYGLGYEIELIKA